MADFQGSESITQAEHISPNKTGDNIQAKRVATYAWDGSSWQRVSTTSSGNSTYGIQAISEDATYKYFWFEDNSANYYILRKHKANQVFDYTAGTGGYSAVYQDSTSGPSGSPTYGDKGEIF